MFTNRRCNVAVELKEMTAADRAEEGSSGNGAALREKDGS
jgi:hypothetical protein